MEMMIGGAFQGKADLAKKTYPGIQWIQGGENDRRRTDERPWGSGFPSIH